MPVIYRKYRASKFSEVLGQDTVVNLLRSSLINNSLAHAYLLTGPRGTGKTSIARILAKAVNCFKFHESYDVCNECVNCKIINENRTIDVVELDAASNRGIEEIRNLKDSINYLPVDLKKKVIILDEVHMLTKEAFNALLKTLEEPPEHVLFVLATTEPHKVPITILSRVQRLDLSLVSENVILQKLSFILKNEGITYDTNALSFIYKVTGGSFRDAESILQKCLSLDQKKIDLDVVLKVTGYNLYNKCNEFLNLFIFTPSDLDYGMCLNLINESVSEVYLIDQMVEVSRDMLSEYYTGQRELTHEQKNKLFFLISNLFSIKESIKNFTNKKIVLEILFFNLLNFLDEDTNKSQNSYSEIQDNRFNNTTSDTLKQENIVMQTTQVKSIYNDDIKSKFLDSLKKENMRAYILVSSTTFDIKNNLVIFYNLDNASKFMLQSKHIQNAIKNVLSTLSISDVLIEFKDSHDLHQDKSKEKDSNHVLDELNFSIQQDNNGESNFLNENIGVTHFSLEYLIRKTQKHIDNSDIIEQLFKDI